MLNFPESRYELDLILKIADRILAICDRVGIPYNQREPHKSKMIAVMDIEVTHCNGCPLQLAEMITVNERDFAHDVFGIRRHLNRETGKLEDSFWPRLALDT